MKKFNLLSLIAIALLISTGIAMAVTGTLPQSTGKVPATIQNLKSIAPTAGKSRCDTVTGTKAIQKSYSTASYVGAEAQAFNPASGAATIVKWFEDGIQVWIGSSYSITNDRAS